MYVMIFDTETTSLNKPFCYNIGYVIADTKTKETIVKKDFVVEQVWHNLPLFSTAYYSEKRPIYVNRMKGKKVIMSKFGYICREMYRDIKNFDVSYAFAFNSSFDEKVFNFNCDWFKCINPFDNIEIKDIRGFAHQFLINEEYKAFCEEHELFTESGNYSTTAEAIYRYITNDVDFTEEHTALNDSVIEWEILKECINRNADINTIYPAKRSIPRDIEKNLTVIYKDKKIVFPCRSYTVYRTKDVIKVK